MLTVNRAGVTSLVKMVMLPKLSGDPSTYLLIFTCPQFRSSYNHTNLYSTAETVAVTIWGGAEGAITIMAASIPVLRTLFRRSKDFTPLEITHHEKPRPRITHPMDMKPLPPTPPMRLAPLRISRRPMTIRVPEMHERF